MCQRENLNLNILGSNIEIYAQTSAFLRKNSPHINQKISEPKQPTDDRTTWPKSPWVVLSTCKGRKKSTGPMSHSCANLQIRRLSTGAIVAGLWWGGVHMFRCHGGQHYMANKVDVSNYIVFQHDTFMIGGAFIRTINPAFHRNWWPRTTYVFKNKYLYSVHSHMAARVALVLNRGAELRTMAGDGLLTATSTKVFHYASRFLCIQRLCAIGRRGMAPGTWQCHLVDMRRPRCWWHLAPGIAPGLAPGTLQSGTWCGTWHLAPGTWP